MSNDTRRWLDAWLPDLALLVGLVPLGTFLALMGSLGLVGLIAESTPDLDLIALFAILFAAGVALLAVCLSSVRGKGRAGQQPRRALRVATFGGFVLGSWLLVLYALSSIG